MIPAYAFQKAVENGLREMGRKGPYSAALEILHNQETGKVLAEMLDPIRFDTIKYGDRYVNTLRLRWGAFEIRESDNVPVNEVWLVVPATDTEPERTVKIVNVGTPEVCVEPQ